MEQEEKNTVDTGLADIPVCTSDISHATVDKDGNPILLYRGYSIYDLIKRSFEECVYFILNGELPNKNQLIAFNTSLKENRTLEERVVKHIKMYPKHGNMMDLLLTTFSFARMFDEDYDNILWQNLKADVQELADLIKRVGVRMGAKIPTIITCGYRILNGLDPIPPDNNKRGQSHLFEIYDIITDVMMKEKGLAQNLDLPISLLYRIIGIPVECNTPIFQSSRHLGWVANMARQRLNKGPLYRPTQVYTGLTLEERKKDRIR